jgi:hypothetical protein
VYLIFDATTGGASMDVFFEGRRTLAQAFFFPGDSFSISGKRA